MPKITVHWFRRDLRLDDNPALIAALEDCAYLIPLFILDDRLLKSKRVSAYRIGFMVDCLHSLNESLRERGSALVIRRGEPLSALREIITQTGANRLTFNRDYSPYAQQRDQLVEEMLVEEGLVVDSYKDHALHEWGEILVEDEDEENGGHPYQIFTPYSKRWLGMPKDKPQAFPEGQLPPLPDTLEIGIIPQAAAIGGSYPPERIFQVGERAAQRQLETFIAERIVDYDTKRNWLNWETSRLSPHIRWGTVSLRRCYYAAVLHPQHEWEGVKAWVTGLAWRDFYQMVLWYYPSVIKQSFRPAYESLEWDNNPDYFAAWCEGRTGYPVVDAAMRQLKATGWMHNRSRMAVASFLCKDLHIDWRWGEQYFMQMLIDGDTAANNGGWQWSAGTGTDAAPYFRVFNPVSQSTLYDKFGNYIRRWVAELDGLPYQLVHTPWHLPPEKRRLIDYPERIVDHIVERKRAIARYKAARNAASAAFFETEINGVLSGDEEDIGVPIETLEEDEDVE